MDDLTLKKITPPTRRSVGFVWLALLILASFCAGGFVAHWNSEDTLRVRQKQEPAGSARHQREKRWNKLRQSLSARIRSFGGDAGVVIEDLQTGWRMVHHENRSYPAASIVKIPIMVACYQAAQEGRLNFDEPIALRASDKTPGSGQLDQLPNGTAVPVRQLIDLMITQSDNTAANALINRLGMEWLQNSFRRQGLSHTTLVRRMMDFSGRKKGIDNTTTPADIALILKRIYRSDKMNRRVSDECLQMLRRQKMHDRIPKKLPEGVVVAHKTGLERGVCHDAGIVSTPRGDYLIVVLTRHKAKWGAKPSKRLIADLARQVYDYEMSV